MKRIMALVLMVAMLIPCLPVFADDSDSIGYAKDIKGVYSSGNEEGNVPLNVFDGLLGTKWAHDVHPGKIWIKLDNNAEFDHINIAFTNGNPRKYIFKVDIVKNGGEWENLLTAVSSGKTDQLETFKFGRKVSGDWLSLEITGSDVNAWSNVSEITGVPVVSWDDYAVVQGTDLFNDCRVEVLQNGTVMLSVVPVAKQLGYSVSESNDGKNIEFSDGQTFAKLDTEANIAEGPDGAIALNEKMVYKNGLLMVEDKFLFEGLFYSSGFEEQSRIYLISSSKRNPIIEQSFAELEKVFNADEMLDWYLSLYDPETGAVYKAQSAVGREGFGPHIESTSQIGLPYKFMSQEAKTKLGKWVQSLQDEETGWFIEPEFDIKTATVGKLQRDNASAKGILSGCGMTPLYPTIEERVLETQKADDNEKSSVADSDGGADLAKYKSWETYKEWMERSYDWTNAHSMWYAGNDIGDYAGSLAQYGYIKEVAEFIASKQNPETGLWGPDISLNAISAAAKLGNVFGRNGSIPYPNVDKLIESATVVVETSDLSAVVFLHNILMAIDRAVSSYGSEGIPEATRKSLDEATPKLIQKISQSLSTFKKADGGFGNLRYKGEPDSQGAIVCLGLDNEADVNGNVMALTVRERLYKFAGQIAPPFVDNKKWAEAMDEKEPITEPLIKLDIDDGYDFESNEIGSVPNGWENAIVVEDPDNSENKAIKINSLAESRMMSFGRGKNERTILKFSLMVGDIRKKGSGLLMFDAGEALSLVIDNSNEKTSVGIRPLRNGLWDAMTRNMEQWVWSDIKIDYQPNAEDGYVVYFYVNDVLTGKSKKFIGSQNAGAKPSFNMLGLSFKGFLNTDCDIYLDNISYETH